MVSWGRHSRRLTKPPSTRPDTRRIKQVLGPVVVVSVARLSFNLFSHRSLLCRAEHRSLKPTQFSIEVVVACFTTEIAERLDDVINPGHERALQKYSATGYRFHDRGSPSRNASAAWRRT